VVYRFKPTDFVIRINGKVRYRILKLITTNRASVYKSATFSKDINVKAYECVSDKRATYYFRDEELELWV
jgi:hypothetical protein